ncbi:hypothetical protein Pmani_038551 [Petrolisthes manimaculis]|uniref:Uncharacterized protein n=1 Tax=Petrolisthes manimaculis TaxID=1843537 RepID=A0AAE1NF10_9EUCA|nr:hypothetical protein Pmani_038551 [Petrolisthes manimaculis]
MRVLWEGGSPIKQQKRYSRTLNNLARTLILSSPPTEPPTPPLYKNATVGRSPQPSHLLQRKAYCEWVKKKLHCCIHLIRNLAVKEDIKLPILSAGRSANGLKCSTNNTGHKIRWGVDHKRRPVL